MIRLWLFVPEVQKEFECSLPENASLADCIPYLNRLLGDELERWYEIPNDALFIDTDSGIRVSSAVTMIHLNLRDGMRLLVC